MLLPFYNFEKQRLLKAGVSRETPVIAEVLHEVLFAALVSCAAPLNPSVLSELLSIARFT